MQLIIHVFLLFVCVFNGINGQDKKYYTGAVVEFASKFDKSETPFTRMSGNLKEYEKYIVEASSKKADIVVFPECGITSVHLPETIPEILPYASVIPDPVTGTFNPCDHHNNDGLFSEQLRRLSCAAKTNDIYLVVNLPERFVNNSSREETYDVVYNTNIVFDRTGTLIARYRKFNLFVEPGFTTTHKAELIKFKTDFGVTFGTFICFDILFKTPALDLLSKHEDVTDIVYPTAWFSELPFLTAVQTQAGWARANGVNLLAAGYNHPENKNGGSGIYTTEGNITFIMPAKHESTLITFKVPIIKKRKVSVVFQHKPIIPINPSLEGLVTQEEQMSNYTTELLTESVDDHKLCHNDFCCVFDVSFNKIENADYHYRIVVYHGERIFGVISHDIQICGLVACTDNKTTNSCGKRVTNPLNSIVFDSISVKGDMFINNSTFIPSYTDYYLGTTNLYFYNQTESNNLKTIEMKNLEPVKNLLGFGVYGTTFNSGNTLGNLSIFLTVIVACFVVKIIY